MKRQASTSFTFSRRACGLLLHPTSLPGSHGSGDLGPAAYRFADFLADAGQTWWQMLPVNPPGDPPGNSPYSSTSAFAGSAYLISLELLVRDGMLDESDLKPQPPLNGHVVAQFESGFAFRIARLRKAFEAFVRGTGYQPVTVRPRHGLVARATGLRTDFERFVHAQRQWLDDWSLYAALRDARGGASWTTWEKPLRERRAIALRDARCSLAMEIRFHQFIQFAFDKQWMALKRYCNDRGVGLIGDIPIFVSHDSADAWSRPELFLLDRTGQPKTVSGYPPDDFNADGQTWGHPQYRWSEHGKEKFAWWVRRFAHALRLFDGVRIDHFLGFHRTWHIPFGATNARKGKWVLSPGCELFEAVTSALPEAGEKIIAEDLGKLTKEASALRDHFNFPGMRVMQFGFGDGGSYHLPHNFPKRSVAYTGTHDNETIVGWLDELRATASKSRKRRSRIGELKKVQRYLNVELDDRSVNWSFVRAGLASCADTIIYPVQDVLGLDAQSRMNVPGTVEGNWRWRLREGQLTAAHAARLRELTELYDRAPVPSPRTRGEGRDEGRASRITRHLSANPSP